MTRLFREILALSALLAFLAMVSSVAHVMDRPSARDPVSPDFHITQAVQ